MKILPDFIQVPCKLFSDITLQPNDWLVYGIVYWYSKMKLQKCILSNEGIAKLINCSNGGVANSLSRLHKGKYVDIILEEGKRKEIIPLLYYGSSSNDEGRVNGLMKSGSSNDEHNKNIYNNTHNENSDSEPSHKVDKNPENYYEPTKSHSSKKPLSMEKLIEIAQKKKISIQIVIDKHQEILDYIADGDPYNTKDVNKTLQNWLNRDIDRGFIHKKSEQDVLVSELRNPNRLADMDENARRKGVI